MSRIAGSSTVPDGSILVSLIRDCKHPPHIGTLSSRRILRFLLSLYGLLKLENSLMGNISTIRLPMGGETSLKELWAPVLHDQGASF